MSLKNVMYVDSLVITEDLNICDLLLVVLFSTFLYFLRNIIK